MLRFLDRLLVRYAAAQDPGFRRRFDHLPDTKFRSMGDVSVSWPCVEVTTGDDVGDAIRRHATGDWGDVPPKAWAENDRALESGKPVLSRYHTALGEPFYIVTRGDRSRTKVLLPHEYHSRWRRFLLGLSE